ncbi:MAG TPA: GNAT family N-acetyltransferase [Pyrinomonadaceae bacterium]|jgi:phosphinothricin acetyltransferase|nr:GNAT family N-acetyltransferase [Pyrinomonadaceae bacterium]
MNIRPVELTNAPQIAEIYNHYIKTSVATFETEPVDAAEMEKRISETLAGSYPFFVAEEAGEILGYAYGHQFRARAAYRHSVEISVYIKEGHGGKGIASLLYERLFQEISKGDFHAVIAGISLPNEASVRLHEKFGMTQIAHFKEVGFKFDRWIDTGYWQKVLNK